jgi:hypothetical protein
VLAALVESDELRALAARHEQADRVRADIDDCNIHKRVILLSASAVTL